MAEKGTLDKIFDCSIECWTQSNLFMDSSTCSELNLFCFMRRVANFVKLRMKKTVKEWRIPSKSKALPPPELSDTWPQPRSLPPSSDGGKRIKHWKSHCKTQAPRANYVKRKTLHERYSSASSSSDTNSFSSRYRSLLLDLCRQPYVGGVFLQSYLPVT